MSVSGIFSSIISNFNNPGVQDRIQQFRKDFQQLGQDLQTGNLSGAQADFAALQNGPQAALSSQSSNPIAQAIQQLSTDLQSGNLTAAQQDYATLQQDFQNQAQRPHHHHHHFRRPGQWHLAGAVTVGTGSAIGRSGGGCSKSIQLPSSRICSSMRSQMVPWTRWDRAR